MDMSLSGKRALVTGSGSGMGRAIAEALAREGAEVACHGRTPARVAEVVESIKQAGGRAFAVGADLQDSTAIKAMCEEAVGTLGGIDIVVNNAGVADYRAVVDMDEEMWDWIIDTNLKAPFLVTKHTLPAMLAQGDGGRLIYTASTNAKTADAEWSAYNTSKHGLVGFVRCLAAEVGSSGITANAICPGWVATKMAVEMHEKFAAEMQRPYDEVYDESMRTNMLGEILPPETIADFAVYLAGETGRYITGQSINVCAGLSYW